MPALKLKTPDWRALRLWLQASPKAIQAFPGEKELLRTATVLVTDTRIVYIDGFDRTLKSYMFQHMLSINKRYYRPTNLNRRLCKAVVIASVIVLLLAIICDITSDSGTSLIMVYIPLLMSLTISALVWRDMRPRYSIEWEMSNGAKDSISTEPMMREWMTDNRNREKFMDRLALAMNEALSAKAWWPANRNDIAQLDMFTPSITPAETATPASASPSTKPKLTLVNSLYEN